MSKLRTRYKLGPTASYVESRQEATFFSSVQTASPDGVRVMTFNVNSDAFLDVNSLFFTWTVTNMSTDKELLPLTCGAHCLIQRMHIQIGGITVGDIHFMGGCKR